MFSNGNLPNITFCVSLLKIHVCFILELSLFILYNMPYIQHVKKQKLIFSIEIFNLFGKTEKLKSKKLFQLSEAQG